MLFAQYNLDDLATVWTAGILIAFITVMVWCLRNRAGWAIEISRFRVDPLLYVLAAAMIACVAGFLLWIATSGRVLSIWALPAAFAFGLLAYIRAK